jgi:hypothetical protein
MELIVLNLGLDLGTLSPTQFNIFVSTALVTTLASSPILYYLSSSAKNEVLPPEQKGPG